MKAAARPGPEERPGRETTWEIAFSSSTRPGDGPSSYRPSPESGDETLGSPPVRFVVVTELLEHQALLRAETKGDEENHRNAVGRARDPVGAHEGLTRSVDEEGQVHRVTDVPVDAVGHEPMLLPHLERDRPVRAQIRVRAGEEPQPDREADGAREKRDRAKRIV